jgi:hypothetical protein
MIQTKKNKSTTVAEAAATTTTRNAGVHQNQCRFYVLILFGGILALIGLHQHGHEIQHGSSSSSSSKVLSDLFDLPTTLTKRLGGDRNGQNDPQHNLLRQQPTSSNNNNNNVTTSTAAARTTTSQRLLDHFLKIRTNNGEAAQQQQQQQQEPDQRQHHGPLNVLLFYADDWSMGVLGKLDGRVHTPNIDRLADNGMLFTNNCVTTSVCWVSRATLATGTYLARHRQVFPFIDKVYTSFNWSETLYPKLKHTGRYFTGLVGKWHNGMIDNKLNEAFHVRRFYYGFHYPDHDPTKQHITDMNREHAIQFLDEYVTNHRDRYPNFFLKVSFFATHAIDGHYPSYMPMNGTRDRHYPNGTHIDPPRTATEQHNQRLPPFLTGDGNEGRTRWKKRFEPEYYQSNIKDMYSMATEVDWAVGEVMAALTKHGLDNNTMIIFTTDNGNLAGEHGTS